MNCGGSVGSIVTDSALIRVIPFGAELCPLDDFEVLAKKFALEFEIEDFGLAWLPFRPRRVFSPNEVCICIWSSSGGWN